MTTHSVNYELRKMSGNFFLDWAALSVSLFDTILLLWLALTVWLNAEKRVWGIWLVAVSLILATIFFASHTVILALGLNPLVYDSLDFWWHLGWIPIIALPYAWYLVTLWYTGFWDDLQSALRQRQRVWLIATTVLTIGLIAFFTFANPLPSFTQVTRLQLTVTFDIQDVTILLSAYALDIILCIVLSLDAFRRPQPSQRVMGNAARERARPWLMATAVVLLFVGLLVGLVMAWVLANARDDYAIDETIIFAVSFLDLIIAALIGVSIVFVGQAVALYEVFTGKTLPRRGLFRQWRSAVILAAGYGVIVAWAITFQQRAIYIVLLTMALMTIFYALFGWRSYVERDRYIRDLRPFVASQRLYDSLLANASVPLELDVQIPFRALCRDVLGARSAYLTAVGPLAPLVPSLAYPDGIPVPPIDSNELAQFQSPQTMIVSSDTGNLWTIPLWSERGLIGVLRLGEKIDGGLYVQEEIEIARASGERLIDTCASAELARRLMALQRQRIAETQVVDRRTRRVLHDDILPRLHTAILLLSAEPPPQPSPVVDRGGGVIEMLTGVHRQISDLLREMPSSTTPDIARLGLIGALQKMVDAEWRNDFDEVTWDIASDVEKQSHTISSLAADAVFHATREAIRNAARYGRGGDSKRALRLQIQIAWARGLQIIIDDDGVGLHKANLGEQGSGHGLALHSAMLAVMGGTLSIEPRTNGGTRVSVSLPISAG
jgi:signal transduction histidine kinase